jgi:VIT1/CCC1 family predicted Fe2+/Mn2+ transporter
MHTNIIERARSEKAIYDLQTKGDAESRKAGAEALSEGITSSLSPSELEKVLDMIASSEPSGEDPRYKRYRPHREDWDYALGILGIDVLLVVPLVAPFLIFPDPLQALYASRLIATVIFATIGAFYAKYLNRRRWLAALFLGTLCFSLFTLTFLGGW